MSRDNSDSEGPVVEFKWNFPLLRLISKDSSRIGKGISSVRSSNIPERIQEATPSINEQSDNSDNSDDKDEMKKRLEDLREDINVSASEGDDSVNVTFSGDVFAPLRARLDGEGTVSWTNDSDSAITVTSRDGPDSFSLTIEPGNIGSVSLDEEGIYEYGIEAQPADNICGAVIVGNPSGTPNLPCETDAEPVTFSAEDVKSDSRTLSEAADEREREF